PPAQALRLLRPQLDAPPGARRRPLGGRAVPPGSRTFGAGAGLLAALALAVMPVSVAANRSNIVDSTLVLVTLLGAWAVLRAAETGRLRWLLLCAVLVGLGFNVKMLQAFLVVPAFGLLYLLAAPRRWTTRIWHLAVATVVLLAISLSWVTAVDL